MFFVIHNFYFNLLKYHPTPPSFAHGPVPGKKIL